MAHITRTGPGGQIRSCPGPRPGKALGAPERAATAGRDYGGVLENSCRRKRPQKHTSHVSCYDIRAGCIRSLPGRKEMTPRSLVILKFGGSVLTDRGAIPPAVQEITRYLASYDRVVAVVSAFKNQTDTLENAARTAPTGRGRNHPPLVVRRARFRAGALEDDGS